MKAKLIQVGIALSLSFFFLIKKPICSLITIKHVAMYLQYKHF